MLLGVCPYCKSVLTENDDIVVCSECNIPHHKRCWIENNGCTTFGCLGTIDVLKSSESQELDFTVEDFNMTRCKNCGKIIYLRATYCENCGNIVCCDYKGEIFNNQIASRLTDNELDNTEVKINKIEFDWNWNAFFLSQYWLIHNKVYLYGITIFIIDMVVMLISFQAYLLVSFAVHVLLGFLGNRTLHNYIRKIRLSNNHISENERINLTLNVCLIIIFIMLIVNKFFN